MGNLTSIIIPSEWVNKVSHFELYTLIERRWMELNNFNSMVEAPSPFLTIAGVTAEVATFNGSVWYRIIGFDEIFPSPTLYHLVDQDAIEFLRRQTLQSESSPSPSPPPPVYEDQGPPSPPPSLALINKIYSLDNQTYEPDSADEEVEMIMTGSHGPQPLRFGGKSSTFLQQPPMPWDSPSLSPPPPPPSSTPPPSPQPSQPSPSSSLNSENDERMIIDDEREAVVQQLEDDYIAAVRIIEYQGRIINTLMMERVKNHQDITDWERMFGNLQDSYIRLINHPEVLEIVTRIFK